MIIGIYFSNRNNSNSWADRVEKLLCRGVLSAVMPNLQHIGTLRSSENPWIPHGPRNCGRPATSPARHRPFAVIRSRGYRFPLKRSEIRANSQLEWERIVAGKRCSLGKPGSDEQRAPSEASPEDENRMDVRYDCRMQAQCDAALRRSQGPAASWRFSQPYERLDVEGLRKQIE